MSKTAWSETDSFQAAGLSFGAWAAVVAGLHLVLGLLLYEPTVFPGGDNADYMILGESLRSFEGYRDLHLPGSPVHTKYPPAYPTLLALLGWIAGVPLFKLASLALTTGTVWLTARWGQRLTGPVPALLAASLLAVNPVLLEYSHYVLSEALFTFLIMLCLITLEPGGMDRDRVDPGAANPEAVEHGAGWRIFALGLTAAALAFLTRTAGLALLIAVPVAAALARRSRHAVTAGLVTVATMAGWGLFQRAVAPDRASYLGQLVSRDPYDPAAGTINLAGLIERAALNAWTYVSEVLPASLTGSSGGSLLPWLGALMGSLALIGWASRLQRRVGPAEVFTVFYAGLIALWPSVWTDRRFLLPLLPLLIVYGLAAARTLLGHLPGGREASWARWGMAVLAVLLALPAHGQSLCSGALGCGEHGAGRHHSEPQAVPVLLVLGPPGGPLPVLDRTSAGSPGPGGDGRGVRGGRPGERNHVPVPGTGHPGVSGSLSAGLRGRRSADAHLPLYRRSCHGRPA